MAYDKVFYSKLRKDRHDAQRAKIFDEWVEVQSAPVQASCDEALNRLKFKWGLSDQQAKSVLVQLILFMHMKPDERYRWVEHGNYIRSEFEWAYPGMKMKEFLREEVPA